MSINTNLNIRPYFNDFAAADNYYQLLFKPSVSVQAREVNQLQSILQDQIEKFGDNIFKRGTILDGCNFVFYNNYQYVKLRDNEFNGNVTIPSLYVGMFARNSANVRAFITNYVDGFESDDPNLKAIYLTYINSGDDFNTHTFSPGDLLRIYDANSSVFGVDVINGGLNFSNSDVAIFSPALAVRASTGNFTAGDFLYQPSTGANVEIVAVDTTALANGLSLVYVRPQDVHMANAAVNASAWTIDLYAEVRNAGNSAVGIVEVVYGRSAQAQIITNGVGKITSMPILNQGGDYNYPPEVTVRSSNNLVGISALDLVAQNYLAQVQVYPDVAAVGNGYAFSVSEGTIYQKGFFCRVDPQIVIVDKYHNSPNNVSVGFDVREEIIDYNDDQNLLDNATGSPNENAPGADRLKLIPELIVKTVDEARANTDFFSIVEWSGGQPYKQNQVTQYSRLGDEMAQRTFDESGNYVIDTFQVSTMATANTAKNGSHYTIAVDPGQAYINGYKVQTLRNFYVDVSKGTETRTSNSIVSLNYGNYVRVNHLGGFFQFSTGDVVDLYDTKKNFLADTTLAPAGNVDHVGTKIGTARARSLIHENGVQGTTDSIERLYIFDIRMNPGANFNQVRSVAYGANLGIADVVLDLDPVSQANVAQVKNPASSRLVFYSGSESLKNSNNVTYQYRSLDQTRTFANTGFLTKSLASTPNEFFPYTGNLSDSQLRDIQVVPYGNNLISYFPLGGSISVSSTSTTVNGTDTDFITDFRSGDWINFKANASANTIRQIDYIIDSDQMVLTANAPFSNTDCQYRRAFPKNVPIPFGEREGLSANVDVNGNILTFRIGDSGNSVIVLEGTTSINTAVAVNIERRNIDSESKVANRNRFVKLRMANNAGFVDGPWCLGVPDIFRLRNVYQGDSSVNTTSYNVTHKFYIDHNQNADFYDLGWLYLRPKSGFKLTTDDYLLVELDYFTRSDDGYFDTTSYIGTANAEQIANIDSQPLSALTTTAATLEIPELNTSDGKYYDLIGSLDFRPAAASTVEPTIDWAAAPLNPASTVTFGATADPNNDKKFPVPDSLFRGTVEQYMGRTDSVFIAGDRGNIYVLKGISDLDPRRRKSPNHPKGSLKLQTITVPPYPNYTDHESENNRELMSTSVFNIKAPNRRVKTHLTVPVLSAYEFQLSQPMVYTMEDIANLERRIRDLEYYTALSAMETNIANKIIPSSLDPTITRFKYGFFADDFSTQNFSDLADPQYAASIETEGGETWGVSKNPLDTSGWANSDSVSVDSASMSPTALLQRKSQRAVPPKFTWIVPHFIANPGYIDDLIVIQTNATESRPKSNCVPNDFVVTQNVVSNTYFYTKENDATVTSEEKTNFFTFDDEKSGQATIWFDFNSHFDRLVVKQGNNVIASSDELRNQVQSLTPSDKAFLSSNNYAKAWFNLGKKTELENTWSRDDDDTDYITGVGKIKFNHNPVLGNQYSVTVDKGDALTWKYLMEYPLTTASTDATTVAPCSPNPASENIGTIALSRLRRINMHLNPNSPAYWSCSKTFQTTAVNFRLLNVWVAGLKPLTQHRFYFDGQDYSQYCYDNRQDSYLGTTNDATINTYDTWDWSAWSAYNSIVGVQGLPALVSDAYGRLSIFIGFTASAFSYIDAIIAQQNLPVYGSSGYSVMVFKGPGSIASKLVAQRKKDQPLPWAPGAAA